MNYLLFYPKTFSCYNISLSSSFSLTSTALASMGSLQELPRRLKSGSGKVVILYYPLTELFYYQLSTVNFC